MDTNNIEVINKVSELLTSSGAQAIAEYTQWYFVNAIVWFIVGIALICFSIKLNWAEKFEMDKGFGTIFKYIFVAIGFLIAANNIHNLASPQAYAIHTFIQDVKS